MDRNLYEGTGPILIGAKAKEKKRKRRKIPQIKIRILSHQGKGVKLSEEKSEGLAKSPKGRLKGPQGKEGEKQLVEDCDAAFKSV